jgi:hypothetical protein
LGTSPQTPPWGWVTSFDELGAERRNRCSEVRIHEPDLELVKKGGKMLRAFGSGAVM